jgi:hypothetical protein
MSLTKMRITNLDKKKTADDREFDVLFNPTDYTVEQSNTWTAQNKQGSEPEYQFTQTDLKKLSMELFFDSYEAGEDVRKHTDKVARLMTVSVDEGEDGRRPPICELSWGEKQEVFGTQIFPFQGVLTSLRQQFVLFDESGIPVRARLSVTFQEYLTPDEIQERFPRRGSFPPRRYVVRQGDSLSLIAGRIWRRPEDWRRIARANGIQDPRALPPGLALVIPAVK